MMKKMGKFSFPHPPPPIPYTKRLAKHLLQQKTNPFRRFYLTANYEPLKKIPRLLTTIIY